MTDKLRASILESATPGFVTVVTPYHAGFVSDIKTFIDYPFRKYDPATKHWMVDKTYLETLVIILEKHFDEINTNLLSEQASDGNLFAQLFEILPNEHRDKVYRVLAQVFHPDKGGSTEQMSQLNEAYQQRRK